MNARKYRWDDHEVYYQVSDGAAWWIASDIPGGWAIADPYGQQVSADSELGQQIVAAITAANGQEISA